MKNSDLLKFFAVIVAAVVVMTMAFGCKKDEKPTKTIVSYENGFNTTRRLFINQQQVSATKAHIVHSGDVIEARNAMHTGGIVGATISINGHVVNSMRCECELSITYVVN